MVRLTASLGLSCSFEESEFLASPALELVVLTVEPSLDRGRAAELEGWDFPFFTVELILICVVGLIEYYVVLRQTNS